ncbi:DNA adenine methylase [Succinivibrio sp.]|uniref:DNA adenine methylase n=1 Tax=Succinivibrio sp. TaxID=2053619 RepID=UPI0025F9F916|nr:DNA adenine methylase [Succinivibrio sp.]MBQ9221942.1 DNA adenine methylase [Succinivibrio sp.]
MHSPNNFPNLKPFVKWVGGKTTSIPSLLEYIPEQISTYVEPFVGSGAVLMSLNFDKAIINDSNSELINAYNVIKSKLGELEFYLSTLIYDRKLYDEIRAWDRSPDFDKRSDVERASRFIFLMKTCYNGLYRVSKKNFFNTPFGNYKNPTICDTQTLEACSAFFNQKDIRILCQDYQTLLEIIPKDAFVYLDPPYFPVSKTANFTQYQSGNFKQDEHQRLYEFCLELHRRGIKFLQSNSDVPHIRELYRDFNINTVAVSRRINSNTSKRNAVNELIITNYDKDSFELVKIG